MRFWDTSALVPLIVEEPSTAGALKLLRHDPGVIAWMLTSVEMLSAFARLGRAAGGLDDLLPGIRQEATAQFAHWTIVTDADAVRRRAERLVGIHPLAGADALQLGAALVASGDRPETLGFVTLDRVLARAADLEGFPVLAPGASPVRKSKAQRPRA
jgi:hypothetical protein